MDIALAWNPAAMRADWVIANGQFQVDGGLRSAVMVSLFTDAAAPADYVPPPGRPVQRGGFWGNTYLGRAIGSLLWTLATNGNSSAIPGLAKTYCEAALKWLIANGSAAAIDVETGWISRGNLGIVVRIRRPQATVSIPFNFQWLWQGASLPAPGGYIPPASTRPWLGELIDENQQPIMDELTVMLA